ncbi:chorismate-binding protein [Flavobacterium restrictum]|uniref:isochorismate synthase n=1 Tax=Flavobacterium restrictum TaxID=2594428 RepID=A0A553ED02_9FLAO|nr:chorismate-binding protein [Flavobacterium restrictum]TRX42801.1 isochorismate synthase [Flavobacterium restrictum]
MTYFISEIRKQHERQLPFVLYSKPNSDQVIGLLQQNDTLYSVVDFTEKGFVFASFDGNKTYFIPDNQSEEISFVFDKKTIAIPEIEIATVNLEAKKEFQMLVAKGIQAIENETFKKVVLSRQESLECPNFDAVAVFHNLVELYPSTFVYCFFHPKVGMWLGATPEQLVRVNDTVFETIALAGTQKDTGTATVKWQAKETEEQQIVTDYIVTKLQNIASEVHVSDAYSVKAGSIWHIKTNISGVLNANANVKNIIELLHPTPAVCGLPKEKAKAFIIANEQYDRTFYTGFLGELNRKELNMKQSSDLFVNLRCMQIKEQVAIVYMGCGITKDSIPEKEWEESVNKSMTMKRSLVVS